MKPARMMNAVSSYESNSNEDCYEAKSNDECSEGLAQALHELVLHGRDDAGVGVGEAQPGHAPHCHEDEV
eukprot:3549701-Lingulodinium_polyedra.AAC.1